MKKIIFFIFFLFFLDRSNGQTDGRGGRVVDRTADSTIVSGNTYAIIIGLSKYKNVDPLHFADKDALAFESFLLNDAGGKIPAENIETFINERAVKANVGDAISTFVRKARSGDRIYFFFAGHGDMEDLTQVENGLLLLYNSPNGNYFGMNDDVLEILDLKRYLSPLSQRGIEVYFIVDACHAGNLKGGVQGIEQTATALAASWGKEFKILSCQPNQLSLEGKEWGGGRGLFSLELEEGMKGMADKNNDGKITLQELMQYITDKVSTYSEGSQIPLVMGDLTKKIAMVNPEVLTALKRKASQELPMLAVANTKGLSGELLDSLDPVDVALYKKFEDNLKDRNLIGPKEENALATYRLFERLNPHNQILKIMRRNLAAALNDSFNVIVTPLLKGSRSYSSREACGYVAVELDSCLNMLGPQHYMYDNIKARKLYMEAMALSWALTESEYNTGLKNEVERAVSLLEQSEQLEPNAAYTLSALGARYFYVYEYDKAFDKFNKYLELRPKDYYARYSLIKLLNKLKQYEKAETLARILIAEYPGNDADAENAYALLCEAYFNDGKKQQSLAAAREFTHKVKDKKRGYFQLALYYSKTRNADSAKHYYQLCKRKGDNTMYDNNIAYCYLMDSQLDSASWYFTRLYKVDTTFAFPIFNLGTIDAINGNYRPAITKFIKSIEYSVPFDDAYIMNPGMYFNKTYRVQDKKEAEEFRNKEFNFSLQYLSYLSILYCYLRDPELSGLNEKIEYIFSRLRNYKEYDAYTFYHYACYMAISKNKDAAIENINKALTLGFGNYFILTSDEDLDNIRQDPGYIALLKKYFPDKMK